MELPHRRSAGLKWIALFGLALGCAAGGCHAWSGSKPAPFDRGSHSDAAHADSAHADSTHVDSTHVDSTHADSTHVESGADASLHKTADDGVRDILAASRMSSETGLGPSVWVRVPSVHDNQASSFRWRYSALEDLLGRSGAVAVDWNAFTTDSDTTVAANAAMGLVRLGLPTPIAPLADAVRSPTLPFEMRCAAAESLGFVKRPGSRTRAKTGAAIGKSSEAVAEIRDLIAQYGDYTPAGRGNYVAELHAELTIALGRQVNPFYDDALLAALRAPTPEVRLAAVSAIAESEKSEKSEWKSEKSEESEESEPIKKTASPTLPKGLVDARLDGDAKVRAAAVYAIIRHGHPKRLDYAAKALRDTRREPRAAAIDALGALSDGESLALLETVMTDGGELDRIDAAKAFARRGAKEALLAAVKDKSARVRRAVAEGLARFPDASGEQTVRLLLKDPSGQVRAEAVRAVAAWSLRRAGPILLEAMALRTTQARREASSALADRWPPAREFPVDAEEKERAAVLDELHERYAEEVGFPQEEATVRRDASPKRASEEETAAVEKLTSSDREVRRSAARELLELALDSPLHAETVMRLVEAVLCEDDPLLWQTALATVAEDGSSEAARLAVAGLGHPDAEVRRRACLHLEAYPNERYGRLLAEVLDDESAGVTRAAIRAIGACGPNSGASTRSSLAALLGDPNEMIQVEAAAVLARWKVRAGLQGLERAALSEAPSVRQRAAEGMGATGDPTFLPHLVRLLDDRQHVRLAALAALSKSVGNDTAGITDAQTTTEKTTRWKTWYEKEHGTRTATRIQKAARE